ncbi:hypothetical protein ACVW00_001793 [Marmoricola sp. URHA0025 HA25]
MKPPRRIALVLLTVPLVAALAGCGAGAANDSKSSAGSAGSTGGSGTSDFAARAPDTANDSDSLSAKPAADTAIQRSVIATGALRLSTARLSDARQDAINLANGLGGHVADEQSQSDAHGRLDRVDLSLRVPAGSFEKALDELSQLGTVRHRDQSVEDVTTKVIDTDARVKAQQASVDSIQKLLARASTIAEIMSIEGQLATRQADLDSLVQQQKWLADQTSLSTIQVTLARPAAHHASGGHPAGLIGGLEGGWHALGRTAVVTGTVIGAVLPFALVVALVGVPVWLVRRRRLGVPEPAPET